MLLLQKWSLQPFSTSRWATVILSNHSASDHGEVFHGMSGVEATKKMGGGVYRRLSTGDNAMSINLEQARNTSQDILRQDFQPIFKSSIS
jgi:hypothetical protein